MTRTRPNNHDDDVARNEWWRKTPQGREAAPTEGRDWTAGGSRGRRQRGRRRSEQRASGCFLVCVAPSFAGLAAEPECWAREVVVAWLLLPTACGFNLDTGSCMFVEKQS